MAKRVFFSFYYQDVIDFRANVVRQHWLTKPDREAAGFFDASIWGNAKLSAHSVRYGGHAVNVHGYNRLSQDLDIVVESSRCNAGKLLEALGDLGLAGPRVTLDELSQPGKLVPLSYYGGQILTSVAVPFDEMYRDRVVVVMNGLEINIVSREHLLRLKAGSTRAKDRRDYRQLMKKGTG